MKKAFGILILSTVLATASFAQTETTEAMEDQTQKVENIEVADISEPTAIKFNETPEAVQQAFKAAGYTEEGVVAVYKMDEKEGTQYKITLNKEDKNWDLTYDSEGKLVNKEESKKS
ncbi:MAG TPA: PepSY-like domain-containing protein [Cryomorphaceae bacterium]|nr:PepSY-like domain-containing protein [Cryomorphaceae bacterium]